MVLELYRISQKTDAGYFLFDYDINNTFLDLSMVGRHGIEKPDIPASFSASSSKKPLSDFVGGPHLLCISNVVKDVLEKEQPSLHEYYEFECDADQPYFVWFPKIEAQIVGSDYEGVPRGDSDWAGLPYNKGAIEQLDVGRDDVFRSSIFCSHDNSRDVEFFGLYQREGWTGLEFFRVWSK